MSLDKPFKNLAILLSAAVFIEMGEKMGERFLPLYITALGGTALAVGFLNAADNLLSAVYSLPGGWLSDRLGYKRSLVLFNLAAIAGYLVVIFFPSWKAALLGAVFFISWSAVSLPAIMSAIARLLPFHKRTLGVSLHSLARRVPMALGPVLGGFCVQYYGERDGVRLAFGFALALAVIALFLQHYFLEHVEPPEPAAGGVDLLRILRAAGPKLRRLLAADILIRFCEQIPYAFVVIWCVKDAKISPVAFGLLTALEMTVAVLIYIPVARMVEKTGRKKPYIAATFVFFTAFPLALLFSRTLPALAAAFAVRGLKEFGEPTRKALILDLSPENGRAGAYGAYYFVRDAVVALAAFGGGFLWEASPRANLLTAFAFGVLGTAYFLLRCED